MRASIRPTSKVLPVAKSPKPPMLVNPHDSGTDALSLRMENRRAAGD
jgi:hypothetical protein